MSSVTHRSFSCSRDGLRIAGDVFLPADCQEGDAPPAVVCHEFLANRHLSWPYARALAELGYTAYCFDFCGGGIGGESDGSTTQMSVLTEVEDLRAVVTYVSVRHPGAAAPLLVGCSQGGLVAGLFAAEKPNVLSALVLLYPALTIPDDARAGTMLGMSFDPKSVPDELSCGRIPIGKRYVTDVQDMDAYSALAGYKGRVLIIHGNSDTLVPLYSSQRATREYQAAGADAHLAVIPGAGHIFWNPWHRRQAIDLIAEFVVETA